jgi:hypothetical protein
MFFAVAVPALWVLAALLTTWLPAAATARALRGRALVALLVIAVALPVTVLGLAVQPLAGLVAAGAAVVGLISAPRLVRLRRAARGIAAAGPGIPAPPAVRAGAGHPQIVIPVQGTAYAAAAGLIVTWTSVGTQATVLPVMLATAAGWGWSTLRQPAARVTRPALPQRRASSRR